MRAQFLLCCPPSLVRSSISGTLGNLITYFVFLHLVFGKFKLVSRAHISVVNVTFLLLSEDIYSFLYKPFPHSP